MLYLELFAEFGDYLIVEICTIVRNDPLGYTIPTNQSMPNKPCHDVLGHCSKGSCFNPLRKVINSYQDETMPVGCRRSDLTDHINPPYCKRPRCRQDIQRNWRNMHLVCVYLAFMACPRMLVAVSFHGGPETSCPKDLLCHCMSTGMCTKGPFM